MKLNCDLGESFGAWKMGLDDAVMPHIDQANIACGFHAGDPLVLQNTLALAKEHSVTIGAHPGYPDQVGFGRRSIKASPAELKAMVQYQIAKVLRKLVKSRKDSDDSDASSSDEECRREKSAMRGVLRLRKRVKRHPLKIVRKYRGRSLGRLGIHTMADGTLTTPFAHRMTSEKLAALRS